MKVEVCPVCGNPIEYMELTTLPPISVKQCFSCGWSSRDKSKKIEYVSIKRKMTMSIEEAIKFLEQYTNNEVYTEKCVSAHEIAIAALRSMPEIRESDFRNATKLTSISESGKPLTVEQLRQMNGSPVWVERQDNELENSWGIVCLSCNQEYVMSFITVFQGYAMLKVHFSEYGKTWLAYSYPPAHIDRGKWKPCKHCEKACWNCRHNLFCCENNDKECDDCVNQSEWIYSGYQKHCSWCGYPLTEEAWAELERRLKGENS